MRRYLVTGTKKSGEAFRFMVTTKSNRLSKINRAIYEQTGINPGECETYNIKPTK